MISLLALFICIWSLAADAAVEESVQVRIFNPNLRISRSTLNELVKDANLARHGYKKKTIQELNDPSDSPTGRPTKINTIYYYKDVPCNRLVDEEVKLDKLLKGVFGPEVEKKVRKVIRGIKPGKCSMGVEFHSPSHCMKRNGKIQKRSNNCGGCYICAVVKGRQKKIEDDNVM